jgi:hypothetical protein
LFFSTLPFFFAFIATKISPADVQAPAYLPYVMIGLAFAELGIGIFFRRRNLLPAAAQLRVDANNVSAITRWRLGNLFSFCISMNVVLFGFVLKILGSTWIVAGPFFAAGILLLVLWRPRMAVSTA